MINTHHNTCNSRQLGVTLIELMVAMAVSSVVMLGVSNIYLSTKKAYVVHDEFARIQENGRYAIDVLSTDIRNAGYFGCSSGQTLAPDGETSSIKNGLNGGEKVTFNLQTGIFGFDAVGSDIGDTLIIGPHVESGTTGDWITAPNLKSETSDAGGGYAQENLIATVDAAVFNRAVPGSDIVILRTTSPLGVSIAKNNDAGQIFLDDTTGGYVPDACAHNVGTPYNTAGISGICENEVLLISDCTKSRIFKAENMAPVAGGAAGACGKPGIPCFNLTHNSGPDDNDNKSPAAWKPDQVFGTEGEIIKIVTKTFFIGVNTAAGITEPTLYVRNNDGVPQPLVEGIENMQILYGVDTNSDGSPNRYFSADKVPDVDTQDGTINPTLDTIFDGVVSVKLSLLVRTPQDMPGINRTVADFAALNYALASPASPITIDPIPVDAASTDRRMRKVYNLTIKIRNRGL